jgi:hypothetical protein
VNRKIEIKIYTTLLDLTLKQSTLEDGEEGYWTPKVKKYTILTSDIPAEYYAFSDWADVSGSKAGSLSTLFAPDGQLYNTLTDNGVKDRPTILPRTLRKHKHRHRSRPV